MALQASPLGLLLSGASRPRVETHPEYAYSFGDEAAELMERAGRPLDQWQRDGVTLMLACKEDGQWACYEYCEWVARQNGKGGILEARVLTGFLLLGEELILWSAHLYKTAMELFRRMKALIRALGTKVKPHDDNLWLVDGILIKISNTNGDEGFERLDTGARVLFLARSAGGGRGMSGDVNIIDETFAYTHEQHSALLYTLSARPNAQIIYTSSPPLKGEAGEIMFELRRRGDPTAPREPMDGPWEQDDSLGYRDWGLAGDLENLDGFNLDDLALAAASNPALGIRITIKTIRRELRSDRAGYPRERLGIWPKEIRSQNGAISLQHWENLADLASKRVGKISLGVDVTPERDRASIAICGVRADGRFHWQIIDERPGTDWVVKRLVELKRKHKKDLAAIVIDGKGPASSLIAALAKAGIKPSVDRDKPEAGDLLITGPQQMAEAWGQFVDAVIQLKGRHKGDASLTAGLAGAKTRPLGDGGQAWGRKGSSNIAPLVAVTLAHYGFETRAHLIVEALAPNLW